MAVIDSLSILLKADTKPFISGMKKAMTSFKRALRGAKLLAGGIGLIGAALTGISGFSLAKIFQDTLKEADKVGKLSDEIGITVDALFGLEHAATISGTSMEVLVRGLQRMNRRIGEASLGYGEGAKALEQLNIKVEDLLGKSADEQFLRIGDSVNALGTQAEKAAAVYALFGRQGQFLLNTFQLQREGIKELMKESERLLGTYSRDEFRIFEELNDSVVRLKLSIKGFALGLGRELATKLVAGITALTDALVAVRERHLPSLMQSFQNGLVTVLQWINRNAEALVTMGWGVLQVVKTLLFLRRAAIAGGSAVADAFMEAVTATDKLLARLTGLEAETRSFSTFLSDAIKGFFSFVTFSLKGWGLVFKFAADSLVTFYHVTLKVLSKLPGISLLFSKAFHDLSLTDQLKQMRLFGDVVDGLKDNYKDMLDVFSGNAETVVKDQWQKGLEKVIQDMINFEIQLKKPLADLGGEMKAMTDAVNSLTGAMEKGSQEALKVIASAAVQRRLDKQKATAGLTNSVTPRNLDGTLTNTTDTDVESKKQTELLRMIVANTGGQTVMAGGVKENFFKVL